MLAPIFSRNWIISNIKIVLESVWNRKHIYITYLPSKPFKQTHLYDPTSLTHPWELTHGLGSHSFISVEQITPVHPTWQTQRNDKCSLIQIASLRHGLNSTHSSRSLSQWIPVIIVIIKFPCLKSLCLCTHSMLKTRSTWLTPTCDGQNS